MIGQMKAEKDSEGKRNVISAIRLMIAAMLLISVAIIMTGQASALGVTPSRTILNYEPNKVQDIDMLIVNNEMKSMKVLIYAQGDLAEYASLGYSLVKMDSSEQSKPLQIELTLPDNITKPGEHQLDVYILEFPEDFATEKEVAAITSKTAVISQIRVNVPYPGKYIEATMHATDANAGEAVRFVIPVFNFGTQDLGSIKAKIHIYSSTNDLVGEIDTNDISLQSKKQADLKAEWGADVNPGNYHAAADIDYDGNKMRLEANFNVGSPEVLIKKLSVNSFVLGDIAKVDVLLYNNWNQKLENIYGELIVKDKDAKIMSQTRTASISLDSFTEGYMNAYWNTAGMVVGTYDAIFSVYNKDKRTEKDFKMEVFPNSVQFNQLTGMTLAQKNEFLRSSMIISAVVILVVLNIVVISLLFKGMKPPKNRGAGNQSARDPLSNLASVVIDPSSSQKPRAQQKKSQKIQADTFNKKLYSYIQSSLSKGLSEKEIVDVLRTVGWDDSVIRTHIDRARDEKLGLKDEQ